ncbi:hypothetical protein A2U01_0101762 [Trifolium medium]|uniref:Uncharacterized protein n=1 Tax=Trifolium medium TaxID=97028 RepID=A0A392V085_9FABA|nr:hypothetical protein [Trifolium medium]
MTKGSSSCGTIPSGVDGKESPPPENPPAIIFTATLDFSYPPSLSG